jgi:type IV secretory pathway VirD2 relaxase
MFSMRREDFEAAGFTSWKPVIREALESFEKQHGIKLEWIAAEHMSSTHPHVHVDVKSVYTDPNGTRHRLRITQQMRADLRASVERIIQREHSRREEERRHERELNDALKDIASTLLRGLRDAARADERESDSMPNQTRKRRPRPEREDDDRGR